MRSDWVGAPLCRLYSLDHVHHQVRKVSATTSASGRAPFRERPDTARTLRASRCKSQRYVAAISQRYLAALCASGTVSESIIQRLLRTGLGTAPRNPVSRHLRLLPAGRAYALSSPVITKGKDIAQNADCTDRPTLGASRLKPPQTMTNDPRWTQLQPA